MTLKDLKIPYTYMQLNDFSDRVEYFYLKEIGSDYDILCPKCFKVLENDKNVNDFLTKKYQTEYAKTEIKLPCGCRVMGWDINLAKLVHGSISDLVSAILEKGYKIETKLNLRDRTGLILFDNFYPDLADYMDLRCKLEKDIEIYKWKVNKRNNQILAMYRIDKNTSQYVLEKESKTKTKEENVKDMFVIKHTFNKDISKDRDIVGFRRTILAIRNFAIDNPIRK